MTKPRPLQEASSLMAQVDAVRRAIWARNDDLGDEARFWDVMDILDDFVVVRQGIELLKVSYSFDDEGVAQLGEPEPVTFEAEPVQMSGAICEVRLVEAGGAKKEGWTWEVDVIQPGWSLNRFFYPAEVLAQAVENGLFEGVKVFAFPETQLTHHRNPLNKRFDRLVGRLENARVGEGGKVAATLHFLKSELGDELRTRLVRAWESGKKNLLGLSIDARATIFAFETDEGPARYVARINEVLSTDAVIQPAAGGKFTQLVASMATEPKEPQQMKPQTKRLWKLLKARRPEALEGLSENTVTHELLLEAMTPEDWDVVLQEAEPEPPKKKDDPPKPAAAAEGASAQEATTALQETRLLRTEMLVERMVQESKLPELAQRRLATRFKGQVAEREVIQAAIDEERDYLAELMPARVAGLGGARPGAGVQLGAEKLDRVQAAFDRSFGLVPEDESLKAIKPLGLRGLYNEITGHGDPDVSGVLSESVQQMMLQEAFTNATLPRVVANTLHRRLTRDYRELSYGEDMIASVISAADFRTREAVRVGYFGDLPDVDPEAADFAEIPAYGDGFESYSVGQKGGLVTITRKHIINDDVGHVAKVTGRLGRSARRTYARFVWDFFISNPLMQDGVAWFAAGHNNLLAVALTVAALDSADLLLFDQTEPDSGEKLGLSPYTLVVPGALKTTAYNINQSDKVPGSANNDANRWHHAFGEGNERINVLPFLTDANDWGVFSNKADVDIVEIAFLNGQEEPELWLADQPTVGEMFKADKIQYKIRHEYGGVPVDHRGAVKAVVV